MKTKMIPIGTVVTFHQVVFKTQNGSRTYFRRCNRIKSGQIVGGTWKFIGDVEHSYGYGEAYEQGFLKNAKGRFVYLIREFYTSPPLFAFPEDILIRTEPSSDFSLPLRKGSVTNKNEWTDVARKEYSEYAKQQMRGPDGRFIKTVQQEEKVA